MNIDQFIVCIEYDEDGVCIGSIPSILGCYAQGATKVKMLSNLEEVLMLCIRN
jgi:predicted RNase H-like HicB family nuclease